MASALIADAKERNNVQTADAFSALLQQKISLKAVKAAKTVKVAKVLNNLLFLRKNNPILI